MTEPVLHLAKRAIKQPDTLKVSEVRRLAEWVLAAYKQREKEVGRIDNKGFTIEGNELLGVGWKVLTGAEDSK